jgi:2-keto-4-pentenoate hydratase/2-oxohepta-3-ene-1,7-dioic acid hydratase in catechol pathway
MKGLDGSCPIGPVLLAASEVADPHKLRVKALLNGTTVQDANTA